MQPLAYSGRLTDERIGKLMSEEVAGATLLPTDYTVRGTDDTF